MSKNFTNLVVVIPRNEDSDPDASLRVTTDTEKETVTIEKHKWGGQSETITFPKQFLGDVVTAMKDVETFLAR